jgi:hypothetical protein
MIIYWNILLYIGTYYKGSMGGVFMEAFFLFLGNYVEAFFLTLVCFIIFVTLYW